MEQSFLEELNRKTAMITKKNAKSKFQKKDTFLYVNQKALNAEEIRMEITNKEAREEATSKRAAIEGINSALKVLIE